MRDQFAHTKSSPLILNNASHVSIKQEFEDLKILG